MRALAAALCIVGAAIFAVGLYVGLATISRDGITCGSALQGVDTSSIDTAAQRAMMHRLANGVNAAGTRYARDCAAAVDDRRPTALLEVVLGGAMLLAGLAVGRMHSDAPTREIEAPRARLT